MLRTSKLHKRKKKRRGNKRIAQEVQNRRKEAMKKKLPQWKALNKSQGNMKW
jgi:hypothetical protein